MRKTLIVLAAAALSFTALPAVAADAGQARPYTQDRDRHDDRGRDDRGRGHDDRGRNDDNRGRDDNNWNNGRDNDRYGRWDNRWGARPNTPPRHWSRQGDWYRHVRACQMRYRSYNPRTDMFVVRRGVMQRCRL